MACGRLGSSVPKGLYISKYLLVFKHLLGGTKMPRITISLPDEIKRKMDAMPEVDWSEVIRRGFERKVGQLKKFKELVERGEI